MIRPIPVTTAGGWETHRGMELEAALRGDEEAFLEAPRAVES
jgi:hypothetical protein